MRSHHSVVGIAIIVAVAVGVSAGVSQAQDDLSDSLIQSVQSRNLRAVEAILSDHPEMAANRYGPGVPILLFAAFAQNEEGFIRPEVNPIVASISKRLKSPDIFAACVTGDLARVETLMTEMPSLIDTTAPSGWSLMHFAAFSGNVELLEFLRDHGGNINARAWRSSKIVPLLSGLLVRRRNVTEFLLNAGADPLVRENGGFSAMHEAASLGDTANIRLLADWGTELNSRRDNGDRPIDLAKTRGHGSAVELLKELGADE